MMRGNTNPSIESRKARFTGVLATAAATCATFHAFCSAAFIKLSRSFRNQRHAAGLQGFQKAPGQITPEFWIIRFDAKKKSILRRAAKLRHVKYRVIGLR